MYKVIDIGALEPSTGEVRVSILEDGLVKTASTAIQKFWDGMERRNGCAYLWVIGVSAMEYYGCNNNGDAFTEKDLMDHHKDFVENAHVFMHHVNKDPARSIGKPVYSWYNPDMHRVELVLEIRKDAPGADVILAKLTKGEQLFVSMGCSVAYDVCSICGNKAPSRAQYCDHLRYNMKKILPDGRQVFALNPNPKFFDISLVNKPADPTAFALDKVASLRGRCTSGIAEEETSAALGEISKDITSKTAALKKISDIIKEVDGTVAEGKNMKPEIRIVRALENSGFEDFDYPDFDIAELTRWGVSPAGLMRGLAECGTHLTIGDAIYMAGRHFFGDSFCPGIAGRMLGCLPGAIRVLRRKPSLISEIVRDILSDYGNEFDTPKRTVITLRIIRPVAAARTELIDRLVPDPMKKHAKDLYENPLGNMLLTNLNTTGEKFAPVEDGYGNRTTRYHLAQADATQDSDTLLSLAGLGFASLLAASAAFLPGNVEQKMLGAGLLAIPSAIMLNSSKEEHDLKRLKTRAPAMTRADGTQVSSYIVDRAWKEPVYKKEASILPQFPQVRLGTALGVAVPGALALDYAFNKWRYRNNSGMESGPTPFGRLRETVGRVVMDNPMVTALGGGIIGSQLGRMF